MKRRQRQFDAERMTVGTRPIGSIKLDPGRGFLCSDGDGVFLGVRMTLTDARSALLEHDRARQVALREIHG
ncbi:hypothetical protein SAMN02983003_0687 [Devosia enhydra]|uniref:Uncharacterized protein n=1 Tax=Devosia enhydra TaxID=665118 RepID=A0A1K2HUJ8_9HYPH|nr:hypothetical protein SAMN02983003_0687 [Devosia enhydra]